LTYKPAATSEAQQVLLWDRKAEGGFPETKILKQRVRNHIEPEKKLGHSDTPSSKDKASASSDKTQPEKADARAATTSAEQDPLVQDASAQVCEDCK